MIIFLATSTSNALARSPNNDFVKTANYFLMSVPVLDAALPTLSTFDVIVIPVEAQIYNGSFFKTIREKNPNIIILAYVATVSWNDRYWGDELHQKLLRGIQTDWWLTDATGAQKSVWPGTRALNLNSGWTPYLASFVKTEIMSTGLWDGIFYDEVQDSISWLSDVDVNRDRQNDSVSEADQLWRQKYPNFSQTHVRGWATMPSS